MVGPATPGQHLPQGTLERVTPTYGQFTEGQEVFHAGFTIELHIAFSILGRYLIPQEQTMASATNFRMTLTPEQKEQIRRVTGKEAEAIELSVEELEERIAPMKRGFNVRKPPI
jgi:hypothetical protein